MTQAPKSPTSADSTVGSIWAVGRNYAAHAKELKNDIPTEPMIFLKSGGCIVNQRVTSQDAFTLVPLPKFSEQLHHELEIAIAFGQNADGSFKPVSMALALDMTARDLQDQAKAKSHPWTLSKSFKAACPLSQAVAFCGFEDFKNIRFELKINGDTRQIGDVADLIFPLDRLVTFVTEHFPVRGGDLLLTGTPSGVAQVVSGDVATATWSLNGKPLSAPILWKFV